MNTSNKRPTWGWWRVTWGVACPDAGKTILRKFFHFSDEPDAEKLLTGLLKPKKWGVLPKKVGGSFQLIRKGYYKKNTTCPFKAVLPVSEETGEKEAGESRPKSCPEWRFFRHVGELLAKGVRKAISALRKLFRWFNYLMVLLFLKFLIFQTLHGKLS